MRRMKKAIRSVLILSVLLGAVWRVYGGEPEKPRVIATTDGEIDDRCSMVRFLLYANEWDIEGLIISSSRFHWKGHNWHGTDWIDEDIDLYAQVYDSLRRHADYPSPEELKKFVYVGNIDHKGAMDRDTPGSDRIVEVLLDDEGGPVYLQAWGGTNTIARALWKIQNEYPDQMEKVSRKAVIYIILDQDKTFRNYIQPNWPEVQALGSFRQFAVVAYGWRKHMPAPQRKYFEADWMQSKILKGHGPLCASYEGHSDGRFRSEGDSPSFMHQIRVGLGSLEHPAYGGWGGRFVKEKNTKNVWRGAKDDGSWEKPLWRWAPAFQKDWAARADWCVKSFEEANHNPVVVVNGSPGKGIVRIRAKPGSVVKLNASGSSDPDGDSLSYNWWYYKGPSTFSSDVKIRNSGSAEAGFVVPYDDTDNEFHIILTVKDNGTPNLYAYRRVIVESEAVEDATPPRPPSNLKATALGPSKVRLNWTPAADPESGIRSYLVYRNGKLVAKCNSTHFKDTGLRESTEYAYRVAAVNGVDLTGAKSSNTKIRTKPDRSPPSVEAVLGRCNGISVLFNEPVERASAERTGNYTLSGNVKIVGASLESDRRTVTLEASPLKDGLTYTLVVKNIRDRAKGRNRIFKNRKTTFTYFERKAIVSVGVKAGETPVKLHGPVKQEKDGSYFLAEGPPWKWITVGKKGKPLQSLEGLESFTVLGWAKATSLTTGPGGNRLVFNLNYNRSGIDLVHHSDGKLRLSVNEWPDRISNDSSPGKIRKGKWIFFAVTYDCSKGHDNVCWYFGDERTPAQLDRKTDYCPGPTGTDSGPLTIGNYNTTIHRHGLDRQFRGWLRGITIFASSEDSSGALDPHTIRMYQSMR